MQAVWAYSVLVFCLAQFVHLGHANNNIPEEEREKWANLMHNMAHIFYRQRNKDEKQFAFLVVGELQDRKNAPESIVLERWNDIYHNGSTIYPISNTLDQQLLNVAQGSRYDQSRMLGLSQISPQLRDLYVNYVAASVIKQQTNGVTKKQHTEHTLLEELGPLNTAYKQSKGKEPNFVLLYTWIFPCADPNMDNGTDKGGCTVKIIKKMNEQTFPNTTWIVGYTQNGSYLDKNGTVQGVKNMSPAGNEYNKQLMISNKISVIQVPCDSKHLHKKGNNGINVQNTNQEPKAGPSRNRA